LDEYNINGINITTLDDFAGLKSLRVKIASYKHVHGPPDISNLEVPVSSEPEVHGKTLPTFSLPRGGKLLVWIDDNPDFNEEYVEFAQSLNIKVYQLSSTALAKIWIDENIGNHHFTKFLMT
jgi:hypothetical protein